MPHHGFFSVASQQGGIEVTGSLTFGATTGAPHSVDISSLDRTTGNILVAWCVCASRMTPLWIVPSWTSGNFTQITSSETIAAGNVGGTWFVSDEIDGSEVTSITFDFDGPGSGTDVAIIILEIAVAENVTPDLGISSNTGTDSSAEATSKSTESGSLMLFGAGLQDDSLTFDSVDSGYSTIATIDSGSSDTNGCRASIASKVSDGTNQAPIYTMSSSEDWITELFEVEAA